MSDPKSPEKKGGGIFDKVGGAVKGFFVEEEEAGQTTQPAEKPATTVQTATPRPQQPAPYRPPSPTGGVVDPVMRERIAKAVHEAALPAYAAFETVFASFQSIQTMDEATRVQAALNAITTHTTETQKFDLAAVLKDIDECLQVLDAKEREADEKSAAKLKERVGSLESEIEAGAARIAQIREELAGLETAQEQKRKAVADVHAEIGVAHRNYKATAAAFRAEITEMQRKITTYGKGA